MVDFEFALVLLTRLTTLACSQQQTAKLLSGMLS